MEAFGIFQGGGLKGYAHVGALQACDARGLRFKGVAGTSIGAVVAALAAAGYTGTEMFSDKEAGHDGVLAFDLIDVLSQEEWESVERLRATLQGGVLGRRVAGIVSATFLGRWLVGVLGRNLGPFISRTLLGRWLAQPLLYMLHLALFRRIRTRRGAMGLDRFIRWLDSALRQKLGPLQHDGMVRFSDLPIPLKCIAADLTGGGVRVFGESDDHDAAVAEAVAASACFPFLFQPVRIDGSDYVDGGLISNLPAWVFDAERQALAGMVPTLGFRLVQSPTTPGAGHAAGRASFTAFLGRLLNTTLAATRTLEDRRVDDYYAVDLTADVGTFAFDQLLVSRVALVERGRAGAEAFLGREIGPRDPEAMRVVLQVVANALRTDLDVKGRVRTYVFLPLKDGSHARIFYSAFTNGDADERLVMRRDLPSPARCLNLRQPVLLDATKLAETPAINPAHALERALRRREAKFVYASPIFDDPNQWRSPDAGSRSEPYAGFGLDCDEDVANRLLNPDLEDRIASYAQIVGEHLRLGPLSSATPVPDPDDARSPTWSNVDAAGVLRASTRIKRVLVEDDDMVAMIKRAESRLAPLRHRHPVRRSLS